MKTPKPVKTKTVKFKLTPAQRKLLEAETKGVFTGATFTFPVKMVRPPQLKVGCVLDRVARPAKGKE